MSKVLQFFGIGKKQEGQGLQMLQNAQAQGMTAGYGGSDIGSYRNTEVAVRGGSGASVVVSNNLPAARSNILATNNAAAKDKIDVFRSTVTTSTTVINPAGQPGVVAPQVPAMAPVQSQRYYSSSEQGVWTPANLAASQPPALGVTASQSARNLSAIEYYSKPVEGIAYNDIRTKLTNFVDRTFPSPFPSRISDPEDFDNSLVSTPYPANHIEFLMENSKYSDKSKENQKNKFMNYKKEIEFCKRYINMNEVKKQKLLQEIEDYKRRQGGMAGQNFNDPGMRDLEVQLQQNDAQIAAERRELEQLRAQLQASGIDPNQFGGEAGGYAQEAGYYGEASPQEHFNAGAFSKKVNAVQAYEEHFQPESGRQVGGFTEHAVQGGQQQMGYSGAYQGDYRQSYEEQGYQNEQQHYGHQGGAQYQYQNDQYGGQPRESQYSAAYGGQQDYNNRGTAQTYETQEYQYYDQNTSRDAGAYQGDYQQARNSQQRPSATSQQNAYYQTQPLSASQQMYQTQTHTQTQYGGMAQAPVQLQTNFAASNHTIQTSQSQNPITIMQYGTGDFDPLADPNAAQRQAAVAQKPLAAAPKPARKDNPLMRKI